MADSQAALGLDCELAAPWSKALRIASPPAMMAMGAGAAWLVWGIGGIPWWAAAGVMGIQSCAAGAAWISRRRMVDRARESKGGLAVELAGASWVIPWSSIHSIQASKWSRDRRIQIQWRLPSGDLSKVSLSPRPSGMLWPGQPSPIAVRLAKRSPLASRSGF